MADASPSPSPSAEDGEGLRHHLAQHDHWTFLLALVLVAANVVVNSRAVSAAALAFLLAALAYDAYEFYAGAD